MWPDDETLTDAWRALVADPDTAAAFAASVLAPLIADTARTFSWVDPDTVYEAASGAVLALLKTPGLYDPGKLKLPGFLRMAARGDVKNLLDKESRRNRGRIPWDRVALDRPSAAESERRALADHPGLLAAVETLSECDRRVFELMLDGERDGDVYAAALGLSDRPVGERAAEVKRAKDRVLKKLQRAGGALAPGPRPPGASA